MFEFCGSLLRIRIMQMLSCIGDFPVGCWFCFVLCWLRRCLIWLRCWWMCGVWVDSGV